jgi:DNA-binding MarR family transcriptional regulator
MSLQAELHLKIPFSMSAHEAVLNIYYTASCLKKRADLILNEAGLTDVQFNLLMLLKYQTSGGSGLSQTELSEMMLVNRANITSLVDRMEKAGYVKRRCSRADRRRNMIEFTEYGQRLLNEVEPLYSSEIARIMSVLDETDQHCLIDTLECVRKNILPRPRRRGE